MSRGRNRREDITEEQRARLKKPGCLVYGETTGIYVDNDKHPLDWAKCGSDSNYAAHRRRGQEPCDPCRKAMRLASTVRRDRARARKESM